VVSVLHERGPLAQLREIGGQVIFDDTNGYGHAVWNYKEGNERGAAWEQLQVRPDSRTVWHIDYTRRVRQLESFLPICGYCKKIRDDRTTGNRSRNTSRSARARRSATASVRTVISVTSCRSSKV
jgi:hypothetical protein